MNTKPTLLMSTIIAIVVGTAGIAENKFLVLTADETTDIASCSAPADMVAIVSNILPKDAYLARTGPSAGSDYRYSYYGLETRAFLTQSFMITTDTAAAEVCNQLEQGNVTPDVQQRYSDAVQADLLWWPVEASKDLAYNPDFPDPDQQTAVGYLSAKHVTFVTLEEWEAMNAPNALGYLQLGSKTVAVPVVSIADTDTDRATAVAAGTTAYAKDALAYCVEGYDRSDLYWAFNPTRGGDDFEPITLPVSQTEILIENGVWSGCRVDDQSEYINEFIGMDVGATIEVVANCPAKTIEGFEIDAQFLPESYGAAGGLGTNFALLCPAMTVELLQADCDEGNEYTCESLAEFLER